eukprot:6844623-Pyramimonas_sp.AAC.1
MNKSADCRTSNDELKKLLYRFSTFKACASRIEQDFIKCMWVFGDRRLHGTESTECDEIKLVVDRPKDTPSVLCIAQRAQEVWNSCYGVSRDGA